MTLEEAAEMILAHKAWEPCAVCKGQGSMSQERAAALDLPPGSALPKCEVCDGAGYFAPSLLRDAYLLVGTDYPEKPLSGHGRRARIMKQVEDAMQKTLKGYIGMPNTSATVDAMASGLMNVTIECEEPAPGTIPWNVEDE